MTAHIALLGWGSLLWEGGSAFDSWHKAWRCDGPVLKIEFSRISSSRGGALTLVIDPQHGVPVRVAWCLTRRQTIREAIGDLCEREGTKAKHIGRIEQDGKALCRDNETRQAIQTWEAERKLAGVIWTDLQSNFANERREPFSIRAAMRYLNSLKGESRIRAVEYLQRAPSFVQTPLRNAFRSETDHAARSGP
jgi:hypothetical protein